MKWLNCAKIKVMLVGFVAAVVLGGGSAKADFTFGEPTNLGQTTNTPSGDCIDCFSSDGLEMYLDSRRSGGYGNWDLWVARRPTTHDDWGTPENLGSTVNSSKSEVCACISGDGLELYFESYNRPGGYGTFDLWVTKRPTKDDNWGPPENLGPIVNGTSGEGGPWISSDGLELYFNSNRYGGCGSWDIWVTRRVTINDPWEQPINLGAVVNSSAEEGAPFISADGLLLFFSGGYYGPIRPGGFGNADMWLTRRASVSEPWGTPVNLGPIVNSPRLDCGPRISPDGCTLYFSSERPGGFGGVFGDIYQALIIPIVDFNDDNIVDSADICIMIDHWGQNYSLCDIGPTPLGDGIVDIKDMVVLAEYMFDKALAVDLCAHWKLDETEGNVAQDSIGDNDALIFGGPTWLPDMGQVNGALLMDGVDDWGITNPIQKLTDEPFRVFAWIKGGAPGQVVLSQSGGVNWLCTDPSDGYLMTELSSAGDDGCSLVSETVIADGEWHRIGLVWDGSNRTLYVDDVVVAKDAQDNLNGSTNSLYIGSGSTMQPGTYWSGLLDDVCIYVSTTGY